MECNIHFAGSLHDNTRVTNVQVSLHRWVPQGQHFPTKFTWSPSGKTKVANGIAEAWASKASMPGTGFSIDSWLICLRLRGVVWFWWKVKNLLFHDVSILPKLKHATSWQRTSAISTCRACQFRVLFVYSDWGDLSHARVSECEA